MADQEWHKTLTQAEIKDLTDDGRFPLPSMKAYSRVKEISRGVLRGAIGLGNITEFTVMIIPVYSMSWCGVYLKVDCYNNDGAWFSYEDAAENGIPWADIIRKLQVRYPWDAHLLSVHVKTILGLYLDGEPTYWDRPRDDDNDGE